ncbi:hypothetical protein [Thermocoleostomius sinensis]|uniref:Uncharacterized protein n=1 Tax=Thermocoleostomius sinensis A174 TaxID=2016057 RepID=A0A9E9C9C2_9CYAN|nr:hypothetical protein [Thermocoleostomius sinensis]WAL62494.1 hypothetical protein OXH18_11025 [Thermocoleostomius sinensis A174]
MTANSLSIPRFCREQRVYFIGGIGTIKHHHREAGCWTYLVEMEMGPEPDFGRIGHETTIQLFETDLIPLCESCNYELAV